MSIKVEEITCKSALTGAGEHYRLNPYGGCEHACAYCYATYLSRWRGQSGPWGTWVQAKTNIPRVLERELTRRRNIEVFLSTACDVYQPAEEEYRLTRQCLSVLALAAQQDGGPSVFLVTKSDRVLRDLDVLVISALRDQPHPTHQTVEEALEVIASLRPRRAFLTHLDHELGHAALSARLPVGVEVAWDGLELEVP